MASKTISGPINLSVGLNTITIIVTAQDRSTQTYTVGITRAPSSNANLAVISLSKGTLSPAFTPAGLNYSVAETNSATSITLTPTVADATASVTVNSSAVTSGQAVPIGLSVGLNTVTIIVTAQDRSTQTYTVGITRAPSSNANLARIVLSNGTLSPAFTPAGLSYSVAETNATTSITLAPTVADATALVTVNGSAVTSGQASGAIMLNIGNNTIPITVTAQDKSTQTYTLTVSRAASNDAYLANLSVQTATLSPAFAYNTFGYTASVPNETSSVAVKANVIQAGATFTVNSNPAQPKIASDPIQLNVGSNTITIAVTAPDNSTTQTYTVTITRAASAVDNYIPGISVTKPTETPGLAEDGILVHQGISPNGDGVNDFLQIDNISQYPDNKLTIMNRNGQMIYEAKGYDNSSKVFDGHSTKDGQLQLPGTYFYQLDYTVNGTTKHKTGFIVLKY